MKDRLIGLIMLGATISVTNAFAAENCKDPQSQMAINACAGKDYELEDARLNKTYKELAAKLGKDRRDKLRQIQLVWLKYRDLQCAFNSSSYEGGSMFSMVNSTCLSQMTKQRNQGLKAMLEEASK